jgi:hypothetical protein
MWESLPTLGYIAAFLKAIVVYGMPIEVEPSALGNYIRFGARHRSRYLKSELETSGL